MSSQRELRRGADEALKDPPELFRFPIDPFAPARPRVRSARGCLRDPAGALQHPGAASSRRSSASRSSRSPATRARTCARTRTSRCRRYNMLEHKYHLDRAIPVRYWYWVEDVVHAQARHVAAHVAADLARHHADVRPHRPGDPLLRGDRARARDRDRHLLGDPPVLRLRLLLHVVQLPQLRHADVLARAAASDPFVDIYLKWHVRLFYTSGLNNPGHGTWSIDRLQHIALPVITLALISFAALQPLHAGVDARRDQQRLRAHGAREGRAGDQGDLHGTSFATH